MQARLMLHSQALGRPAPVPPHQMLLQKRWGGTSYEPLPQSAKWEKSPKLECRIRQALKMRLGVLGIPLLCASKRKQKKNQNMGSDHCPCPPQGPSLMASPLHFNSFH